MAKEPTSSPKDNPLIRALARWEWEGGGLEPDKEAEAAGERQRSKLDYRNAPSDLTPAQKDLLNQDRIPTDSEVRRDLKRWVPEFQSQVRPRLTAIPHARTGTAGGS